MFKTLSLYLFCLFSIGKLQAQPSQKVADSNNEGIKLKNAEKYLESLNAFEDVIGKNSDNTDALYEAGWLCNELKQYDSAIIYLQKAKQLRPSAEIFFELGYAYKSLNKDDEAKNNFIKALELYPKYYDADKLLGDIFYTEGNYANALSYFKKYFNESRAPEPYYYYKAGKCSNDSKDYSDALLYLEKYQPSGQREFAKKYTEVGYAYSMIGYNDNAISAYQAALNANAADGDALRGIADIYYNNLQDYNKALEYFNLALQNDEANSKECYYKAGWIYIQQQKYNDAIIVLQKAIGYDANDKGSREELGYAFYMLSKYDDAIFQFNKAIELDQQSRISYYYKGFCYAALNQKDNAMEAYDHLRQLDKDASERLLKEIKDKDKYFRNLASENKHAKKKVDN